MTQIDPKSVRKHFLTCQRTGHSGKEPCANFSKCKEDIEKLSDEEIIKEILTKWSGKSTNAIFVNDSVEWVKKDILIDEIINPYLEVRQIFRFPKRYLTAKEISELIDRQYANVELFQKIASAELQKIEVALPIFARKEGDQLIGIDGWFRILTLKFKGCSKICAYVAEINPS